MIYHVDLRNKFLQMHTQLTPYREREIHGACQFLLSAIHYSYDFSAVHFTSVTDTQQTSTIIQNGA
jgi:hypothetical protein